MASKTAKLQDHYHTGKLWHSPDFLKLWIGETVSLLGSEVTTLALPLTAIVLLKATPLQMGLLSAAGSVPFLLVTLFAGVWIDHKRRRPTLIIANIGRAILLGLVPLLAFLGYLRIEYLFIIALLTGILTVFFQLAYEAYLPRLVEQDQLVEGNSKLSLSSSLAELGGPGLAGILVQAITAPFAILVDAFSFLFSALNLLIIHKPEPSFPSSQEKIHIFREMSEGIHLTVKNSYLRAFAGEAATYNLFWEVIQVVLVLFAVRQLHLSSLLIGLIFAVGSVGSLFSALVTERLARKFGVGKTMIAAQMLGDIATLFIPLTAILGSQTGAITCMILAFFLRGAGNTMCNVHVNSVRQTITPDAFRGRTNAVYRLLVSGVVAIGALLGGVLGQQLGLQLTLLVGALGVSSSWLWLLCSSLRRLHQLPSGAEELISAPKDDIVREGKTSSQLS